MKHVITCSAALVAAALGFVGGAFSVLKESPQDRWPHITAISVHAAHSLVPQHILRYDSNCDVKLFETVNYPPKSSAEHSTRSLYLVIFFGGCAIFIIAFVVMLAALGHRNTSLLLISLTVALLAALAFSWAFTNLAALDRRAEDIRVHPVIVAAAATRSG